jgi:selenium metabolism protein YedF
MKVIDVRGRPCPQPVVEASRAIDEGGPEPIRIILDDESSCENVARMARGRGLNVSVDDRGKGEYIVTLGRGEEGEAPLEESGGPEAHPGTGREKIAVLVGRSTLGDGDAELGRILMRSFIKTLDELSPQPDFIIFLNGGVYLTTEGSDLLDDLGRLEASGTAVLSCGTCLDFFKLKAGLKVGRATNMFEIASILASCKTLTV